MDSHTFYGVFHVFFVAPLLLWVGMKRDSVPEWTYTLLLVLGVGIFAYHAFRAWGKLSAGKSAWINWIHILLVAPIFLAVGWNGKETPRRFFELLIMLGFAALGYHSYHMIEEIV
jgi:hypothetical protein